MTARLLLAALCLTGTGLLAAGAADRQASSLIADLDRIFADPILSRGLLSARVTSLGPRGSSTAPAAIYERDAHRLVVPASTMKLVTVAVAADTLGWDHRYATRLEAVGALADGTLAGDLVVTGSGDPSIGSPDGGHAPLFVTWADALHRAGIHHVEGRLVGDDNAFDDEGLGAGWAWDNLAAGYSAPVGALTYNENAAVARFLPSQAPGSPARVEFGPPGHALDLQTDVTTAASDTTVDLQLFRPPGSRALTIRGRVPANNTTVVRTAAILNPTEFFVEGLRLALASRGITVSGGAWDIDAVSPAPSREGRRLIAAHESAPLSVLAGHALKVSQNLYAETLLKTLSRGGGQPGSTATGREIVRRTLTAWGIPADAVVMADGSGLSRYNYVTTSAVVTLLERVWRDERLRGPFVAGLPVGGRDGSLDLRMRGTALDRNVQAKTGTLSNVRALSGYAETASGRKLVFSMIANHFTAPAADVDAIMERALERLIKD